jgi:hypothetical protein
MICSPTLLRALLCYYRVPDTPDLLFVALLQALSGRGLGLSYALPRSSTFLHALPRSSTLSHDLLCPPPPSWTILRVPDTPDLLFGPPLFERWTGLSALSRSPTLSHTLSHSPTLSHTLSYALICSPTLLYGLTGYLDTPELLFVPPIFPRQISLSAQVLPASA